MPIYTEILTRFTGKGSRKIYDWAQDGSEGVFFARVFGYDYENATEDDWKKWEADFNCFRLGETYCSAEKKKGNSVLLHMLVCGSIPYGVFEKIAETFPEIHADGRFIQQAEEFFGNIVIEKGGFLWTKFDNPVRRSGKKDFVFDSFFREPEEEPNMDQKQKEVLELLKFDRDNMRYLLSKGEPEARKPESLDYHSKFYFSEQELKAIAGDVDSQYQIAREMLKNKFFDNNPKIYNKKDKIERECCEQYFDEMGHSWIKKAAMNGYQEAQFSQVLTCMDAGDFKRANECLIEALRLDYDDEIEDVAIEFDLYHEDDKTFLLRLISFSDRIDLMKYYLDRNDCPVDDIWLEDRYLQEKLTLLEYAALQGSVDIVKLLIEDYKATFSKEDENEKSLLILAIKSGNPDLVKYLIEDCGFDVNWDSEADELPLHVAVSKYCEVEDVDERYLRLLLILFTHCTNYYALNAYGETIIDTAWSFGNEVALELILEDPSFDINAELRNSVYFYCKGQDDCHDFDRIKWLMEHGADANDEEEDTDKYDGEEYYRTAFTEAWENKNEQLMTYFIEQTSFDINRQLVTSISNHIWPGEDLDLLKYLINHGADVNYINEELWYKPSLLFYALYTGDTTVADCLIEAGADINLVDGSGDTALCACVYEDNGLDDEEVLEYVKKLVGLGANSVSLQCALNCAAGSGRVNVVHYLIEECNLDPKDPDKDGDITVNAAAIGNQIELVKWLIKSYNIDINVKGKDGRTPLHESVARSDSETAEKEQRLVLVKWLVENGADINCIDDGKKTPLHIAAEFGNDIAVKYFIEECHMDPAVNYGAGTPADLAKGNSALVRYLHKKEKEYANAHKGEQK